MPSARFVSATAALFCAAVALSASIAQTPAELPKGLAPSDSVRVMHRAPKAEPARDCPMARWRFHRWRA